MNRRLPLLLVSGVVVVCVVGAIVAGVAAGSGFSPSAFSVYGSTVSQDDFNQELRDIADHPTAMQAVLGTPIGATKGSITAEATTAWLGIRIPIELLRHLASARHASLSTSDRRNATRLLTAALGQANLGPAQVPSSIRTKLLDYFAFRTKLKLTADADYQRVLNRSARAGHITVDPRYAQFGPRGLCPPFGCPPTSAGG
jgi:hypothetical protein